MKKKKEAVRKEGRKSAPSGKRTEGEVQVLRRTRGIKIARVILWVMLAFLFFRGVAAVFQDGGGEQSVQEQIEAYQRQARETQRREDGALAFAESFAREYMTYTGRGDADYAARLSAYAVPSVYSGVQLRSGSAEALYAVAYRQEAYSATQYDVWVRLAVRYTARQANEEGTDETLSVTTEDAVLKVPVAVLEDRFVVEDVPAFVTDRQKLEDYSQSRYSGNSMDRTTTALATESLSNFFQAYYGAEQSVIQRYLVSGVNMDDFLGLGGRVTFGKITECNVYAQATPEEYLAVVELEVSDLSGQTLPQRFNLTLLHQDGQYYVRDMAARVRNINR